MAWFCRHHLPHCAAKQKEPFGATKCFALHLPMRRTRRSVKMLFSSIVFPCGYLFLVTYANDARCKFFKLIHAQTAFFIRLRYPILLQYSVMTFNVKIKKFIILRTVRQQRTPMHYSNFCELFRNIFQKEFILSRINFFLVIEKYDA